MYLVFECALIHSYLIDDLINIYIIRIFLQFILCPLNHTFDKIQRKFLDTKQFQFISIDCDGMDRPNLAPHYYCVLLQISNRIGRTAVLNMIFGFRSIYASRNSL